MIMDNRLAYKKKPPQMKKKSFKTKRKSLMIKPYRIIFGATENNNVTLKIEPS
jgi:hypothetical protein